MKEQTLGAGKFQAACKHENGSWSSMSGRSINILGPGHLALELKRKFGIQTGKEAQRPWQHLPIYQGSHLCTHLDVASAVAPAVMNHVGRL